MKSGGATALVTAMQISPLVPILCLLAGACVVEIAALVRFRWHSLILVIATGLAAVTMLPLMRHLPTTAVVLDWRPVTLVGSTASLRVDGVAWLLGLALLVTSFSVALTWLVIPRQGQSAPRALALVMLAAGLGSVFAANLLTLALCWGLLDALFCLSVLIRGGPTSGQRAQLGLGVNGLATLALWAVAVIAQQDRLSPYWHLLILPPTARLLMGLAASLRLGLYPLHIWQPMELIGELDRAVLIYLVPAMAGLSLWARLAVIQGLPEGNIWPAVALVTALVGGVQAWIQSDPRESLPHLALGYGGMLILTATFGKAPAETLAAGSASWLLGLALLFVGRPLARGAWPWAIPAALGAATLAGLPLTLGFIGRSTLYQSASAGPVWIFVLALVAETFLIGAMLRRVLTPDAAPTPQGLAPKIGYAAALVVAVAPVIVLGVIPSSGILPATPLSLGAWIGWGLPLAGGIALAALRVAEWLHVRLSGWETLANQVIRLDWLYLLLLPVIRSPARIGLWLADLLEGDGAFLWMLLILALMVLLRGGQAP